MTDDRQIDWLQKEKDQLSLDWMQTNPDELEEDRALYAHCRE